LFRVNSSYRMREKSGVQKRGSRRSLSVLLRTC
jgi:hypothetical protein